MERTPDGFCVYHRYANAYSDAHANAHASGHAYGFCIFNTWEINLAKNKSCRVFTHFTEGALRVTECYLYNKQSNKQLRKQV